MAVCAQFLHHLAEENDKSRLLHRTLPRSRLHLLPHALSLTHRAAMPAPCSLHLLAESSAKGLLRHPGNFCRARMGLSMESLQNPNPNLTPEQKQEYAATALCKRVHRPLPTRRVNSVGEHLVDSMCLSMVSQWGGHRPRETTGLWCIWCSVTNPKHQVLNTRNDCCNHHCGRQQQEQELRQEESKNIETRTRAIETGNKNKTNT